MLFISTSNQSSHSMEGEHQEVHFHGNLRFLHEDSSSKIGQFHRLPPTRHRSINCMCVSSLDITTTNLATSCLCASPRKLRCKLERTSPIGSHLMEKLIRKIACMVSVHDKCHTMLENPLAPTNQIMFNPCQVPHVLQMEKARFPQAHSRPQHKTSQNLQTKSRKSGPSHQMKVKNVPHLKPHFSIS